MTLCLAIDGTSLSAAVCNDAEILAEVTSDKSQSAEEIPSLIKNSLKESGVEFQELDRVAVCNGPGSFTGIRVGIASAQGVALAHGLELIGVSKFLATIAHHLDSVKPTKKLFQTDYEVTILANKKEYFFTRYLLSQGEHGYKIALVKAHETIPINEEIKHSEGVITLNGNNTSAADIALATHYFSSREHSPELILSKQNSPITPLYIKPPHAKTIAERNREIGLD